MMVEFTGHGAGTKASWYALKIHNAGKKTSKEVMRCMNVSVYTIDKVVERNVAECLTLQTLYLLHKDLLPTLFNILNKHKEGEVTGFLQILPSISKAMASKQVLRSHLCLYN